jgi:survival-of-motor-neuron-related-splicing factor 30
MAEDTHSVEELQANLADYKQQLQQVETLLLSDHTNDELKEMYDNLTEVIQLTEDLLQEAGIDLPAAAAVSAQPAAAAAPDPLLAAAADAGAGPSSSHDALVQQQQHLVTPAQLNLPAMLPASVADQIRKAQVKQALLGQGNPAWAVGSECLALYSGDGQYYKATVKSVTDEGKFVVLYEGYGTEETVSSRCWAPAALSLLSSFNAAQCMVLVW